VLLAFVALGVAGQWTLRRALTVRFDVRRPLGDACGRGDVGRAVVAVLARDRAWMLPVRTGIGDVPFTAEAARRAEDLLARRGGWSMLAADAERLAIGERLMRLDPDGARAAALRAVLQHGTMARALLVSLGSAAPDAEASRVLGALETAPGLSLGRDALYLLAHAHARLGDAAGARDTLGRLKSRDGIAWIQQRRNAVPLVLTRFAAGRVTGRILVDGTPHAGRVAVVSTRDLFSFPKAGGDVPVTWLLRLVTAADCAPDGRFALTGLPEDEMALVVLLEGRIVGETTPLPALRVGPDEPEVDAGTIELFTRRPAP
jgi:hypothetical protein